MWSFSEIRDIISDTQESIRNHLAECTQHMDESVDRVINASAAEAKKIDEELANLRAENMRKMRLIEQKKAHLRESKERLKKLKESEPPEIDYSDVWELASRFLEKFDIDLKKKAEAERARLEMVYSELLQKIENIKKKKIEVENESYREILDLKMMTFSMQMAHSVFAEQLVRPRSSK